MDRPAFQAWVTNVLQKQYPKLRIKADTDVEMIQIDEDKYGLTNLYRDYLAAGSLQPEEVKEHFEKARLSLKEKGSNNWKSARLILRPQIVPKDYANEYKIFGTRPIGKDLLVVYVLDQPQGYQYITNEMQVKYAVSEDEMYLVAVDNLKKGSVELEFKKIGSSILILNLHDSYDASRILVPSIQKKISEILGSEFYFALPNRDFLICWKTASSPEETHRLLMQVQKDFETQPYPISSKAFSFRREGITAKVFSVK